MSNRLAGETSPYLQQHKDNPVDWYPWGEEALARAKKEDLPILLSIGYSACHWCHVMAHESFEDPEVAEAMNRLFVNIKVDREERPDLDQIYQLAHQMLSQRPGGWPLTVFLTPDQVPFFAGTYFPKEPRYGMTSFPELIGNIASIYRERQPEIGRQNQSLLEAFARTEPTANVNVKDGGHRSGFTVDPIEDALSSSKSSFDPRHGGFGGAPKFPHPAELQLCLRRYAATGDEQALHIVAHTLERMALGGIYDQLGGGFSRYSVDAEWMIPHFEKMLYDNGPLLALLADAWTVTRSPLFERVAAQTAEWVMREMQDRGGEDPGGYYSSLDADSEHEEGKFYVWTREQVQALLSEGEYAAAAAHWGLDGPANFEATHWHLRVTCPVATVAQRLGFGEERCAALIESSRSKLFAARERRVRPGRDEKILTSWNALMIGGMARAGSVFGRPLWIESARHALEFIRATLWREGRLLATYKDGRAHLNAYLDDHAFLLAAAIELLQAEFRPDTLEFARQLADALLAHFEDRQEDKGGFFFTSHDHERLIHRSKLGHDNATPSGNGVAAFALQRLCFLTGETRYAQAAERALAFFYPAMCGQPGGHASLLMALEENLEPARSVILRGAQPELGRWRQALAGRYLPASMVVAIAPGPQSLPAVLDKPVSGQVNAWVCEGATCLAPVSDLNKLLAAL